MSLLQKIKAKSIQPAVLIAQRIKAECSSCSRDAWDAKAAQDLCLLGQKWGSPSLVCSLVCVDGEEMSPENSSTKENCALIKKLNLSFTLTCSFVALASRR